MTVDAWSLIKTFKVDIVHKIFVHWTVVIETIIKYYKQNFTSKKYEK